MTINRQIKVLVVDDSPVVRQAIRNALEAAPNIGEVSTAATGSIALKKIRKHRPDVVTMDIEMPGMDGLDTLRAIHQEYPVPVIMLSAYTFEGAAKTIKALEIGAVDFIQKPGGRLSSDIVEVVEELVLKITAVAPAHPIEFKKKDSLNAPSEMANLKPSEAATSAPRGIVAIGASTGGTEAIRKVLVKLPASFPAGILIVQHMPAGFTRAFASRLDELCRIEVKEASHRDMVRAGRALIAPGHSHMKLVESEMGAFVELHKTGKVNGHMPSVDVLFRSVVKYTGTNVTGVLLTGMGRDGADGLLELRNAGAMTIAQDSETSVVYGMPRAAAEIGAAARIIPLHKIAAELSVAYPRTIGESRLSEKRIKKTASAKAERSSDENSVIG